MIEKPFDIILPQTVTKSVVLRETYFLLRFHVLEANPVSNGILIMLFHAMKK